jgi:predicted lipoprotein with Yx(FWY)xxD motif
MQPTTKSRRLRQLTGLAAIGLVAVLAFSVTAGAGRATPPKRVVKLEESSGGGSVLANLRGRTLYSLSVERHGRFICTAGCLSIWHPLFVPKGVKPTGPVSLGTVERPEGKTQVTYRGRPLYSFGEDSHKGETSGEGIKDVGTWHAAKPAGSSSQTTGADPAPTNPYPTTTYPTTPYPTAPAPSETPPPSQPSEPPHEYPPYGY